MFSFSKFLKITFVKSFLYNTEIFKKLSLAWNIGNSLIVGPTYFDYKYIMQLFHH